MDVRIIIVHHRPPRRVDASLEEIRKGALTDAEIDEASKTLQWVLKERQKARKRKKKRTD